MSYYDVLSIGTLYLMLGNKHYQLPYNIITFFAVHKSVSEDIKTQHKVIFYVVPTHYEIVFNCEQSHFFTKFKI